jgi:hypothetical protein
MNKYLLSSLYGFLIGVLICSIVKQFIDLSTKQAVLLGIPSGFLGYLIPKLIYRQ